MPRTDARLHFDGLFGPRVYPKVPRKYVPRSEFSIVLMTIRDKHRITCERIGIECHITKSFITHMENGDRMPSVRTLSRLLKFSMWTDDERHLLLYAFLKDAGIDFIKDACVE
jgi:hypothetical protein